MAVLKFTLSPQHCARFHDVLVCLAKFSDVICLEARFSQLVVSALNTSKSAYAYFVLEKKDFFVDYDFDYDPSRSQDKFACSIQNRALASVFKGRLGDSKTGDSAIERCEAVIEDEDDIAECRLVMRLVYRQGVTKTFKLTYEDGDMRQAVFDKSRAANSWKIQARLLREYMDFFGPKTEHLDICYENNQVTLTSYTEKIMNGKEIMKQPLQTSVSIEADDFEDFNAQELLHIAISVKDFKNIVLHADSLRTTLAAMYSRPGQPLQFIYGVEGLRCEFTLMTIGDYRGDTPSVSRSATREPSDQRANGTASAATHHQPANDMPPPPLPDSRREGRLGRRVTAAPTESAPDADPNSLFIPVAEDDDSQWQPIDEQAEEDMLGWDASANNDSGFHATFRDDSAPSQAFARDQSPDDSGIAPTQRASQVRGLFD